ncbi:hypothetical protein [Vibrio quintilis]|uniref:Uncharacterized protein n=1 Tax=Vibrio quintilis TaxID=1117707 RepID=A0A1M7YVX4_9VIBR|nr:hypothetical protein [Vibrio quintilis]SHO56646.1 hypothetical protein VQ7734_02415 [Vibrio quintilis]
MYVQIEKPKDNKSRLVTNSVVQKKSNSKQDFGFVDNRPDAIVQRKLQGMENNNRQKHQPKAKSILSNIKIQRDKGEIVQRVVRFEGVDYHTPKELWGSNAFSFCIGKKISMGDVNACVKDTDKIYDLENNLAAIDEKIEKTQEQLEIDAGKAATKETNLIVNTKPYENKKTYDVAIDEGAAFLKGGPIELIGTHGLNGCVAVMIECENKGNVAYFLAHVSSHLAGDIELVQAEVNKILYTLKEAVGEEIDWTAFDGGSETKNKILLARSPSESEELFVNIRTVLAKSGATMFATYHTNVTIDFSGEEAKFFGNEAKFDERAPRLSSENAAIKEYGYGKSHGDSEYIESLIESDNEEEAMSEIECIAKADDLKGLTPEEREKELIYQQYAQELGDI